MFLGLDCRKCWATWAGSRLKRILLLSSFTFSSRCSRIFSGVPDITVYLWIQGTGKNGIRKSGFDR